jgi:signal transduction histidine kinase
MRLWRAVVALCLVAAGVALFAALRHGLYANTVLAAGTALWLIALSLRQDLPPASAPEPIPPDRAAADAERRRLSFMLDHAPVPLVMVTASGRPHAVNRAARHLFGADDRITHDQAILSEAIATAQPGQRAVVKLGGRAGSSAGRNYALAVAHWSAMEGPAVLAALIDIEAEIQAAEAAALRELLQTLSHEIMNSLTPVMSLAESARVLLAEDGAEGLDTARDALETIARRARGLERFVRGYREMARVPPPARRPASVAALVRDLGALFAPRWAPKGVRLALAPPAPDIVAAIDADLICQAVMALLTNGAEAALAYPARPALVRLAAGAEGGLVWFEVEDSGAGVAPELAETVFRPLFTLKPGGTGIGLSLARQIALGHGGAITLEPPADGRGAVFVLTVA